MARPTFSVPAIALGSLAAVSVLAACGGGGGGSVTPPATSKAPVSVPSTAPAGTAPASFAIKIPGSNTASAARTTRTVSANTASIIVTLLKTDNTSYTTPLTGTFNVAPGSSICTTDATDANRTCSLQLAAPTGTDIFTVDTYDASGNKLGSGAVSMTVAANQANNATVTLGGTVAALQLVTANSGGYLYLGGAGSGYPASTRIYVLAFDGSGNPIVVPDTYSTAIQMTLSNTEPNYNYNGSDSATRRTRQLATPDEIASVSVSYAFPQNGVTSATTSASNLAVPVYSPDDVITVAMNPTVNGLAETYLYGTIGALPATPTVPTTLGPLADLTLFVYGGSGTPAPVPTAGPLTLSSTSLAVGYGQSTSDGSTTFTASETNYTGDGFSAGTCGSGAANVVLSSSNTTVNNGVVTSSYTFTAYPDSSGSCTVAISDGAGRSQNVTITSTLPPSTIAFTGISLGSVGPTPAPNGPVGIGPAVGTYPYGTAAASLDLQGLFDNQIYVYLTDSQSGTATFPGGVTADTTSCPTVLSSSPVSPISPTVLSPPNYYFDFSDGYGTAGPLPNGVCIFTFHDNLGTPAVLEVYQNSNSLTVSGKGRKK